MNVLIKDLSATIELKNKGMELEVRNTNGDHLGDLVVTKTKLVWCHGKKRRENGVEATWQEFIDWMNSR